MENANMCALGHTRFDSRNKKKKEEAGRQAGRRKIDSKGNTMCVDNKTKLWPVELFSIPNMMHVAQE